MDFFIPFGGGEARPLTSLQGQIGSLIWSPQGDRLLIMFRKKDADVLEREADEKKKKRGNQ